jgi:hypothetical protein
MALRAGSISAPYGRLGRQVGVSEHPSNPWFSDKQWLVTDFAGSTYALLCWIVQEICWDKRRRAQDISDDFLLSNAAISRLHTIKSTFQ